MSGITRRELALGVAGAACLFVVGDGTALAFGQEGDGSRLRPPGGQDIARLRARCIKCDRCRSVCPEGAIAIASVSDGFGEARMPVMNFRLGACTFCDGEYRCIDNCPTGALGEVGGFDASRDRIGVAEVDASECIAFEQGGGCRVCVDACPYGAVSLDAYRRPQVDESLCNGCGFCELRCPSASYRAYSGSGNRGINVRVGEVAS